MKSVSADVRTAEAAALSALYEKHAGGKSHAAFGKENQIGTAGAVWQYLNGHRPLNLAVAIKFARALGIKIDDFSPRLVEEVRDAAEVVDLKPSPDEPGALVIADVLKKLGRDERQHTLANMRFMLERAGALVLSERLAAYAATVDPPSKPSKKDSKPGHH